MNDELPEGWVLTPLSDVTVRVPNANPQDEPAARVKHFETPSMGVY